MNQNPYSTALFSIGAIGMIVAVICFAAGGSAGVGALGALAFAGALFPVAGFALVGWLLLEGSQWKRPAPPVRREASNLASPKSTVQG